MMLSLAAWILSASPPFIEVYRARGTAPVGSSKPAARQQALDAACREAVMQALRQANPPPTEGLRTEAGPEWEALLAPSCSRLAGMTIEEDDFQEGEAQIVLGSVTVKTGPLFEEYGALIKRVVARPHPKLLLLLAERSGTDATEHAWWVAAPGGRPAQLHFSLIEQDLASVVGNRGWHVVDPEKAFAVAPGKVVIRGSDPTVDEALAYGRATGVDYVVLGRTTLAPELDPRHRLPAFSCDLKLAVKVVRVGTGEVVATVSQSSLVTSVVGSSQALLVAAQVAANKLDEAMAGPVYADWKQHTGGGGRLEVEVEVADFGQVDAVADLLRKQAGVTQLEAGDFNEGRTLMVLTVTSATPRTLAPALSNKAVAGGVVHIARVSDTDLALKVGR